MGILKSIISYAHVISATISLVLGTIIFLKNKGNKKHRELGAYYFYVMLVNNITALFIYNALGQWFFPHSLAVAALVFCILGYFAIKNNWLKTHVTSFVISYYLLIGGTINEAYLRIKPLNNHQESFGIVHFIALLFFIGLLSFYLIKYRRMQKAK